MKVVQTRLNELEYALLKKVATRKKMNLKDAVKEAIENYIKRERVDPNDSLFSAPVAEHGAEDGSAAHDRYLYG